MKRLFLILFVFGSIALSQANAQIPESAATPLPTPPKKPEKVETVDGRTFLGFITIKDDYTILIRTDAGLTNLPIASMKGDSWQKYSKDKDREGDGRFWSERQDALTKKWEKDGKKQPLNEVLSEIVPHLADIAGFKASQPVADAKKPAMPNPSATPEASVIEINLFSGPGGFNKGSSSIPSLPGDLPVSLPATPSLP